VRPSLGRQSLLQGTPIPRRSEVPVQRFDASRAVSSCFAKKEGAAKAVWLSDSQAAHADAGTPGSRERNDLALAALLLRRVRPIAREVR
jgi:hypothetical protein